MPPKKTKQKKNESSTTGTNAIGEGGVSRARLGGNVAAKTSSSSSSSSLSSTSRGRLAGKGVGINRAARLSKQVKVEVTKPKKRSRHMPRASKTLPKMLPVRVKKEKDITLAHNASSGSGISSSVVVERYPHHRR